MKAPIYRIQLVRDGSVSYNTDPISTPSVAARIAQEFIGDSDRENVAVLLLNIKNKVVGVHLVSVGSLEKSLVHPREVFKSALLANAATVILVHNHPSGDPTPSESDRRVTESIKAAGEVLGIPVLDHVIVSPEATFSFHSQGML